MLVFIRFTYIKSVRNIKSEPDMLKKASKHSLQMMKFINNFPIDKEPLWHKCGVKIWRGNWTYSCFIFRLTAHL